MASVVRIKRKVGDDPHVALIAAKRRRTEADGASSSAEAGSDTLLQFVGTMGAAETALPTAVLTSMKTARRAAKAAGTRRAAQSAAKADGLLADKATERRRAQEEQQKAMRYRVVSRRRDLSASLPASIIDVEAAEPTAEPAAAAAPPELSCNGVPLERLAVDPAAAYVYDLYVTSEPLECDELELELHACADSSLWEMRTRGGSDSHASLDSEDSNAEDNWRNDYPEELDDSDYERYLEPEGEYQLDLVRQLGAHRIDDDSDDEPLAYGLEEAPGAGEALDDDGYERYKKRVLRELNGESSEDSDADDPDACAPGSGDSDDEY